MTETGTLGLFNGPSVPHRCPICAKDPESYSGKLVPEGGTPPVCENHKRDLRTGRLTEALITMVPVPGA